MLVMNLPPFISHSLHFVKLLRAQLAQDHLSIRAGFLSYVTLLSLVPLVSVIFSMLSLFPFFTDLQQVIEEFVYRNFIPTASETIEQYLHDFVARTRQMTGFGVAALFVVALMLISNIDKTVNLIFGCSKKRGWGVNFAIYWMVLTLGPVLVGLSLALTSYITSIRVFGSDESIGNALALVAILPFLFTTAALLLVYWVIPNMQVRFRYALIGAIVAALLFEIIKRGFVLYLTMFPSYEAIYGALSVIPILFVWVQLCWLVVLFGASLTACIGDYCQQYHGDNPKE